MWLEKNTGYARLDWGIPISQAALIVVDIWDRHYIKDPEERAEAIIQEKIRPLVAACRKSGLQIVHAPSPPQAKKCAAWVGAGKENTPRVNPPAGKATTATEKPWPPADFRSKSGPYRAYAEA